MYRVATATFCRLLITSVAVGCCRRMWLWSPVPGAEGAERWLLGTSSDPRGGRGCLMYVCVCTVGTKSITCAISITRYDINGHNISNFFFPLFLFFCSLLNVRITILKWKSEFFLLKICYDRHKKNLFFAAIFFCRRFFRHCSTFRVANLLLKRAYIPKTTSPFF